MLCTVIFGGVGWSAPDAMRGTHTLSPAQEAKNASQLYIVERDAGPTHGGMGAPMHEA